MKRTLLSALGLFFSVCLMAQAPCNLTNSLGCDCLDGSNNCDLLPDLTIAQVLLNDPSANPESVGELGVSVSSPNIGHGPLRIISTDYFVCGGDTVLSPGGYSGTCPDGSDPRQLIKQRIYHKNPSGTMTYYDRWAGSMTYHISHGHMHVDDWGKYSLRTEVPGVDPINWPIVAEGAKLGFCLMDYGSCDYYDGHCVDQLGNVLTTNAPNYGLGGGMYSCGMTNQGISAGYTDIYYYYLDGMQIPIPASVCNGTYKLVVVLDPYDYFLEEDESNNVKVATVTLTQQGGGAISIVADGPTSFCAGNDVTLSIDAPASSYTWSNGATTPTVTVNSTTSITCTAVTTCGMQTTPTVNVTVAPATPPTATGGTTCGPGSVALSASGAGTLRWFNSPSSGTVLATGATYNTPTLTSTTTYYVESETGSVGATSYVGPVNHTGTNFFNGSTVNGYLIFNALTNFTLKSVKVYTDQAGNRLIELRNSSGTVLQSTTVNIPVGESIVALNFNVPAGTDLQLGTNSAFNTSNFGYVSPQLRRTSGTLSFPYTIADVMSITNTPFGTSYYYYFYNWEVKEQDDICISTRVPVQAIVDNSPGCTGVLNCTTPPSTSVTGITPTGATVSWTSGGTDVTQYQVEGRKSGTSIFRSVNRTTLSYNVRNLNPSTAYEWRVRSRCTDGTYTPYTALSVFVTPAARYEDMVPDLALQPNPSTGSFQVELNNAHGEGQISIENLLGQTLWSTSVLADGATTLSVNADLSPGMYLVRFRNDRHDVVQRLVISR